MVKHLEPDVTVSENRSPTSRRLETLESEIAELRARQDDLSERLRELTGAGDSGKIDASVGPVKLAGSGRWIVALVLAFAAAIVAAGGKGVSWISKLVAP
jgi:hypothetical protein